MQRLLIGLLVGFMLLGLPLLAAADHNRHYDGKRHHQRWDEQRSRNTVIIYQQGPVYKQRPRMGRLRHELRETRRELRQIKRQIRHKRQDHRMRQHYDRRSAVVVGFPHLVFRFDL
jgi:hypothetical protein